MSENLFRVTFLGTGAPPPTLQRFGPSTLVEVGSEKFIFDAGRGAMQRLHQLKLPFSKITGIFFLFANFTTDVIPSSPIPPNPK